MYDLLGIFVVILLVAVPVFILFLPIVALVRVHRLADRLARLERELLREPRTARRRAEPEVIEEATLAEPVAAAPAIPVLVPAPTLPSADERPISSIEAWIGGRGLGWAAVVMLLCAAAFFLKLVIDRGLIDEIGRVSIGLTVGVALVLGGYRLDRRGWRAFAQMLTAAGAVLIYLMTFATFGFYRLLPQANASIFLVIVVIEVFLLALLYNAPAIALMAVVGGLLTPILLHTDQDRYVSLFTYLLVLDTGVILLVLLRPWWASATVALAGTHLLFWLWFGEHYHPAKLAAALGFHVALFLLFLGHTVVAHALGRRPAGVEDLIRLVLNAGLFALAGYILLDPEHHAWLGTCAVGLASIYALVAFLVQMRRPTDDRVLFALVATSMGFVAAVFPLQAHAAWIAVGWAVQGLALWWFAFRVRAEVLRGLGAVFLLLGVFRLVVVDTFIDQPHTERFIPIFNRYGLPAFTVAACVLAAAWRAFQDRPAFLSRDFLAMRVLGLGGVLVLWLVVSIETYDFFIAQTFPNNPLTAHQRELDPGEFQRARFEADEDLRLAAQAALSVVWGLFAVGLLLVGFRLPSRPYRWLALLLLAVTLIKVLLVDTHRLTGYYRVLAFLALSVLMAAAAWAYQKVKYALLAPAEETPR